MSDKRVHNKYECTNCKKTYHNSSNYNRHKCYKQGKNFECMDCEK